MPEQAENKKEHKGLKRALFCVTFLLLMGAIFVFAVMMQSPGDSMEGSFVVMDEEEPLTRMQPASSTDVHALAQLFGAPLAALTGYAPAGQAFNTTHDGQLVRVVTLQYPNAVITAVRPASAAPLLLRADMSVSLRGDLTALNLPAVEADKGNALCLYFSNESAAYSVYAVNTTAEEIVSLLTWQQ